MRDPKKQTEPTDPAEDYEEWQPPDAPRAETPVDLDKVFDEMRAAMNEEAAYLNEEGGDFDVDAGEYLEEVVGDDKHLG